MARYRITTMLIETTDHWSGQKSDVLASAAHLRHLATTWLRRGQVYKVKVEKIRGRKTQGR